MIMGPKIFILYYARVNYQNTTNVRIDAAVVLVYSSIATTTPATTTTTYYYYDYYYYYSILIWNNVTRSSWGSMQCLACESSGFGQTTEFSL